MITSFLEAQQFRNTLLELCLIIYVSFNPPVLPFNAPNCVHVNKLTYFSWIWKVGNLIPRCNKDPGGAEVQVWKVAINVLCGLWKNTATSGLVVVDLTNLSVVKVSPEWSN